MNVRLRESEDKSKFSELFFDTEEAKVISVDGGEFIGSMFQSERKHLDFWAFDVLREVGTRTFNADPGLFSWNDAGRIFNSIENAVSDFLHDVIDGNRGTGILETMAAMVASIGRKERAVGRQDVETDDACLFSNGNQGVKDFLIQGFAETFMKVGEGCFTGNRIKANAGKTSIKLSAKRISQDEAEILDGSNSLQAAKQIEKKERDGIIARAAEDGISNSGNGADEGEIYSRTNQLSDAAGNGTVVVDRNGFLPEFVMGKPTSLFLGEGFDITAIDKFIAFKKLFDKMASSEANVIAHFETPGVSRECEPASKQLPGSPFLLVKTSPATPPNQIKASCSSSSTKTGTTALRSCACA